MKRTPKTPARRNRRSARATAHMHSQSGSAMMLAIVLAIVGALLMAAGTRMIVQNQKEASRTAHYVSEADNAARAGLTEGLSWFKRQTNGVQNSGATYPWYDMAFFPRNSVIVGADTVSETNDETIGLVREYKVTDLPGTSNGKARELWIRYELWRQQYPKTDEWGTPIPTPLPTWSCTVQPWNPNAAHDISGQKVSQKPPVAPTNTPTITPTPVPPTVTPTATTPFNTVQCENFCGQSGTTTGGGSVILNAVGDTVTWRLYSPTAQTLAMTFVYDTNNNTNSVGVTVGVGSTYWTSTFTGSATAPLTFTIPVTLSSGFNNVMIKERGTTARTLDLDHFNINPASGVINVISLDCNETRVPTRTLTPTNTNTNTFTPIPTNTLSPTPSPTPTSAGNHNGDGNVWNVSSIGYSFLRVVKTPFIPFNQAPNTILAKSVASSEFWRMPINLPVKPAAVYTNNANTVTLNNKAHIDGMDKYGVVAKSGTAVSVPGTDSYVRGALGTLAVDSTIDLSFKNVFNLTSSELALLADYVGSAPATAAVAAMYPTGGTFPKQLALDKFYYIDMGGPGNPVTFDDNYTFKGGSGLMIVDGDLVVDNNSFPPRNYNFNGLVYVTGRVTFTNFTNVDGCLVALGGLTLTTDTSPADYSTVTRGEVSIAKMRSGVVSYRENQSAVRTFTGLPPDRR